MPDTKACAKIKDPQERSDCENYRGKYAKKVKSLYKDVLSGASTRDSLKTMKKGLGKQCLKEQIYLDTTKDLAIQSVVLLKPSLVAKQRNVEDARKEKIY